MANEKRRLIDANALAEELSSLTTTITGLRAGKGVLREYMTEYRKSVLRIVDEAPTIEAALVVHGRWIEGRGSWYVCSVCNANAGLYSGGIGQNLSNYCPHCGAKMDGDGNG